MSNPIKVKVVGIGREGCNAINLMVAKQMNDIELIAMDTDARHLSTIEIVKTILLGDKLPYIHEGTKGNHLAGRVCAEESRSEIVQVLNGADLVVLVACTGGGTGGGAISVVADIARRQGALTIGIVTNPETFEGKLLGQAAEEAISQLIPNIDALIPLQTIIDFGMDNLGIGGFYKLRERDIGAHVQEIIEMVTVPGLISVDFADIKTLLKDVGILNMHISSANGSRDRAVIASRDAINWEDIGVAQWLIINAVFGRTIKPFEIEDVVIQITRSISPETVVLFRIGVTDDTNVGHDAHVSVIVGWSKESIQYRNIDELRKRFIVGEILAKAKLVTDNNKGK